MAPHRHLSAKEVIQHVLPPFRQAAAKNEEFAQSIADAFGLDEEQLAWLEG